MADLTPVQKSPEVLVTELRQMISEARRQAAATVNAALTLLYWRIGVRIRREVVGTERAGYGEQIVATVSHQLVAEFGRGFERSNLTRMMKFAEVFPDEGMSATLSHQLSWSHFRELLPLDKPLQRDFYAEMSRLEGWSVRTLRGRIDSMLYERTALSRKPDELAKQELGRLRSEGQVGPALILKDPYILDFLDLKDHYVERDFEDAILRELESCFLILLRRKAKTYSTRRGRLLHRSALLQPEAETPGGGGTEAGCLPRRVQGPDGALPALACEV
jgi:hypothetical protein